MGINQFFLSLLNALSTLEFVEKVDFQTEVFVLKGRVILKKNRFLHVSMNLLAPRPLRLLSKKKEFGDRF
jgi:hypothetical protein